MTNSIPILLGFAAPSIQFTADEASLAGIICGALERAGATIGRAGPMIAAIAMVHDVTLVTGNVGHYERVRSLGHPLRIEIWRD